MTLAPRRRQVLVTAVATAMATQMARTVQAQAAHSTTEGNQEIMAAPSLPSLYTTSVSATGLTGEAADRVAIRNLIDAWAHCADRRLAEQQAALFTAEGGYSVYDGDPATRRPIGVRRGRSEIVAALAALNKFVATTHFNGQSVVEIEGDRAVGESYCLAHQLLEVEGTRTLQLLSIRYLDNFVREDGRWLFADRKLIIDWSDTQPSAV